MHFLISLVFLLYDQYKKKTNYNIMNLLLSTPNLIIIISLILILYVFKKNKESETIHEPFIGKMFEKITNFLCENWFITKLRETAYMLSIIYTFLLICLVAIPVMILLIWLAYTVYSCYSSISSTMAANA